MNTTVTSPPSGDKYTRLSQLVLHDSREQEKYTNTRRCYGPKKIEFSQFCHSVFSEDENPETVTEDKVFIFLFYQAYRAKKTGKARSSKTSETVIHFSRETFDNVMIKYNIGVDPFLTDEDLDLGNVVGHDCVNQYLCAIRKIAEDQNEDGTNSIQSYELNSTRVKRLMKNIKNRKDRVSKKQFKERISGDFKPYSLFSSVPKMENFMWKVNSNTASYGASALRDRFQFLMTLSGVLRSESLYKADLADLCDFIYHQNRERDPYHILILRVSTGKTNADKILYGRVMRHLLVEQCPIGALALYLLLRFYVTNEQDDIDFLKNKSWFNIKLLRAMSKRKKKGGKKIHDPL